MSEIIVPSDAMPAKRLSERHQHGEIRRVYHGIYTDNHQDALEVVVGKHWMAIVSHIVKQGILSFRTGMELKPVPFKNQTIIFVTSDYNKTIELPGLLVKVIQGNNQDYKEPVMPGVWRSNLPRMLLENLSWARGEYKDVKTVQVERVEEKLVQELKLLGETRLNDLRDEAKEIAEALGYEKPYQRLTGKISALLSTHPEEGVLRSDYAKAVAKKEPYDPGRIALFENLNLYLHQCQFRQRIYGFQKASFQNLSFWEAYFSNFIEGTQFTTDEAQAIVFQGKEVDNRHADSHDVLATYQLCVDFSDMSITPRSATELIDLLQHRHALLMKERPEKQPGQFKRTANKAGNTYFVLPDEVIGTLTRGFDIYQSLSDGVPKALFMHYLISEVHPFDDGNGRLSRIMMNAELVQAGLYKIIMPTVWRDNYLNGLRLASRDGSFYTYTKMLDRMHAYSASIDWLDSLDTRKKIEQDGADQVPDEGLPQFNRVVTQLESSILAVL